MKTLLDVLKGSADYLEKRGIGHPKRQTEHLLCDIFGLTRLQLYLDFERPLNEQELTTCRDKLQRHAKGEPLAYIHGQIEFYHCQFEVTSDVLIPRQETEILVDKIAKKLEKQDLKGKVLWDLCCGSGCIGIALKKKFPQLDVTLADISLPALAIAQKNAEQNGVHVRFLQGDLLEPFGEEKADFVVCNPPYITDSEYEALANEVRCYEPKIALVAGKSGVEFYERLAQALPAHLRAHAGIWLEIGYQQGESIKNIFNEPLWKNQLLEKDWAGHPRFFFLENE